MSVAWVTRKTQDLKMGEQQRGGADGDECPWGVYDRKPSHKEPQGNIHIEWVYILDLDNNCFTVCQGSNWSRKFKMENPPRYLFEKNIAKKELLVMPIPLEYLYTTTTASTTSTASTASATPATGHDIVNLAQFTTFAPRLVTIEVSEESHFKAGACLDSWKPLSQLLLEKFLERYITTFKDLASPKSQAIFASTGLDHFTDTGYRFRQLAYGILNLCDSAGRIKFRRGRCYNRTGGKEPSTDPPSWECPTSNVLWMGEVLVILEPRIAIEEFLHAAIGKAIDLVRRSRVTTGGIRGTAVIFSLQALVIVRVRYADDSACGPDISYSQSLPVITPSECSWTRCFGGLRATPTAGLVALLDVFARQSKSYALPAGLPVEICTQIYGLCHNATRKSLAESCHAFWAIVSTYPQIDGWELIHSWNHGNVGFLARRGGPGMAKSVVSLEECSFGNYGFLVGLFNGRHRIDLDLPLLEAVKQSQSGYKGCACCVGLPVLEEAPVMPGRSFTIPDYIEKEREVETSKAGYPYHC